VTIIREPVRRIGEPTRRGRLVPPAESTHIVLYDFRRPAQLSREHVRSLQLCFETFARRLGTLLTSSLRAVCHVNLLDIEQHTYDDYITGLNTPTLTAPISLDPLPGTGVLEFSVSAALACVDHMLGGPGGAQPQRSLTDIETLLVRDLLDKFLGVFVFAMEPIAPVEPTLGALEFNPPFLQAAGSTEMMIVGSFELGIGNEVGVATLCLPFAPLLPFLVAQRPQRSAAPTDSVAARAAARAVRTGLGVVPVDVAVRFNPVGLSPERILGLAVGDILPLNHRVDAPLALQAGATTYRHVIAGREGARLAAQVVTAPAPAAPSARLIHPVSAGALA
jgi:flagellar motor switch protein FliM